MAWNHLLLSKARQDGRTKISISILPDNAPGHGWPFDEQEETSDDDDCSCPSLVSAHSSCCADLRECELSDEDSDLSGFLTQAHEHEHHHTSRPNKPKCRWESCPHSKCCPKLPCRVSDAKEEPVEQGQENHKAHDTRGLPNTVTTPPKHSKSYSPCPRTPRKHHHHHKVTHAPMPGQHLNQVYSNSA